MAMIIRGPVAPLKPESQNVLVAVILLSTNASFQLVVTIVIITPAFFFLLLAETGGSITLGATERKI